MKVEIRRTIGEQPRPRALIVGFEEVPEGLTDIVPTVKIVRHVSEVHQDDYDILITRDFVDASDHMYVLAFGGPFGRIAGIDSDVAAIPRVAYSGMSLAMAINIPRLPEQIERLVDRDLVPLLEKEHEKTVLSLFSAGVGLTRKVRDLRVSDSVRPFLMTRDGGILAGSLLRSDKTRTEVWCLPDSLQHRVVDWLRPALVEWNMKDPERIPLRTPVHDRAAWMTGRELDIALQLAGIEKRRAEVLAELDREEASLRRALEDERQAADAGLRRLVSAEGFELQETVAEALRTLGFDVEDMDALAEPGQKLEDLRVSDSAFRGWVGLAEVRAYKSGTAKSSDLQKIQRFVSRFSLKEAIEKALGAQLAMEDRLERARTQGVPELMIDELVFPYQWGFAFVCSVYQEEGWAGVNRMYRKPPKTTAEIMFPTRYLEGEGAIEPQALGRLDAPWKKRASGTFGAAHLKSLFEAPGNVGGRSLDKAVARAAAWAGGEYQVWSNEDERFGAIGLALVEHENHEGILCDSMKQWYEAAFEEAEPKLVDEETVVYSDTHQIGMISCVDDQVRVGIAPEETEARALIE